MGWSSKWLFSGSFTMRAFIDNFQTWIQCLILGGGSKPMKLPYDWGKNHSLTSYFRVPFGYQGPLNHNHIAIHTPWIFMLCWRPKWPHSPCYPVVQGVKTWKPNEKPSGSKFWEAAAVWSNKARHNDQTKTLAVGGWILLNFHDFSQWMFNLTAALPQLHSMVPLSPRNKYLWAKDSPSPQRWGWPWLTIFQPWWRLGVPRTLLGCASHKGGKINHIVTEL